jgi:hypothetical protein
MGQVDASSNEANVSRKLSFEETSKIVNLLLACDYISNRDNRETVLKQLGEEIPGIVNKIQRRSDNKADVTEIVFTCSKHSGGLEKLAEIVAYFEGETATAAQQLREFVPIQGRQSLPQLHPSTRHDFYDHISLSPNYIERREVLRSVCAELLTEIPVIALTSALQHIKPNALYGMGGIGKTVIARAICDDPVVQSAFPDGILWVTVGQEPELVPLLREMVNVLGGNIGESAPTINSLKNILAKLLKDRACLLILDDVWKGSHVEAFLVGSPRSRLLFTTRDAEIAHELGAKILPIPVMTQTEAVLLLEEWAGEHLTNTNLILKNQIVERLGYLPLAVKLAGAQLRRKSPDEWLATFDVRKLKSPRYEDVHDSLELTFKLSIDALDEEACYLYTTLAIFKKDEVTPQAGIERLWQGLGNLDATGARDLLDDLAARALLEIVPHSFSQKRGVVLHDLLHDLIRTELGSRSLAAHRVLLDTY